MLQSEPGLEPVAQKIELSQQEGCVQSLSRDSWVGEGVVACSSVHPATGHLGATGIHRPGGRWLDLGPSGLFSLGLTLEGGLCARAPTTHIPITDLQTLPTLLISKDLLWLLPGPNVPCSGVSFPVSSYLLSCRLIWQGMLGGVVA